MAVEARHVNAFCMQNLSNRSLAMNGLDGNGNVYGNQAAAYGVVAPLSGITTVTDSVVPMYCSGFADNGCGKAVAMKSDSGLTHSMPHVSRKRSRDAISPMVSSFPNVVQIPGGNSRCGGQFSFLGEDISFQILQQQVEADRFIYQHMEKVRVEMEERRRRYSRRIAAVLEENVVKKLKAKDEEIENIGKLNWALEEKVKSLCVENQIWRDLAHTNEATANSLRCDLERILTQVQDDLQHQQQRQRHISDETALVGDAQSCCDCNYDEIGRRSLADNTNTNENASTGGGGHQLKISDESTAAKTNGPINNADSRICRSCAKEESSVLLLPCRHLCLCTNCGSFLNTCPVCNSIKTASLHVNLSS